MEDTKPSPRHSTLPQEPHPTPSPISRGEGKKHKRRREEKEGEGRRRRARGGRAGRRASPLSRGSSAGKGDPGGAPPGGASPAPSPVRLPQADFDPDVPDRRCLQKTDPLPMSH